LTDHINVQLVYHCYYIYTMYMYHC